MIALPVSGAIAASLAPSGWSDATTAWFGAGVALAGAATLVVLVLVGSVIVAPYRQRNEARAELQKRQAPVPIPNRDALIRAMAKFQDAAIEVVNQQEQLDKVDARSPNLVHVQEMTARDEAYELYRETEKEIHREKLVAGKAFDQPISDLITFMSTQVFLKVTKPPVAPGDSPRPVFTALELTGRIAGKVMEAIQQIEDISR